MPLENREAPSRTAGGRYALAGKWRQVEGGDGAVAVCVQPVPLIVQRFMIGCIGGPI
jgi:hypothetical protein